MTITFDCWLPPDRGNARGHWRRRWGLQQAYWKGLNELVLVKRIPRPPASPIYRARVHLHMRLWNTMDQDNLVSRSKDFIDWLVKNRYLAGDTPRHLELEVSQEISRKGRGMHVTITPIEEAAE